MGIGKLWGLGLSQNQEAWGCLRVQIYIAKYTAIPQELLLGSCALDTCHCLLILTLDPAPPCTSSLSVCKIHP